MEHTGVFFKTPIGGGPAEFGAQMQRLANYATAAAQGAPSRTPTREQTAE